MSFPSLSGSTQDNLSEAWNRARSVAGHIKNTAQNTRNQAAAGPIASAVVFNLSQTLADMKDALQRSADTPGIEVYAQEQISNNTIDIVAEFINMIAKMDAVTSWVYINFPKDVDGYLLAQQFAPDESGRVQDRTFPSTDTAGLRTALDDLIAAID